MTSALNSLFTKLASQELITPYLENAFREDRWPDELRIPLKPHESLSDDYFHPSGDCLAHPRFLYNRLHPDIRPNLIPERLTVENVLSPMVGTIFHVLIQEKLKLHGLIRDEDIEVPLVDERHHGRGRLDIRFPNHPDRGKDIPVDIKTENKDVFQFRKKMPEYYDAQMQCYMDWAGYDEGVILVIEAGRPFRMKEHRIRRNEQLLNRIYEKWDYVRACLATNTPPPEACCTVGSEVYKSCPARFDCAVNEVTPF